MSKKKRMLINLDGVNMNYKKRTEEELRAILGEPNEEEGIGFVSCYNDADNWFISGDTEGINGGFMASDIINSIEEGFMKCHSRGYEASMSAAVNAIFYKWCIIKIKLSDIPNMVESLNMYKSWNVSGGATGIKLKPEFKYLFEDQTKHISAQIINESL